MNHVEKLKGVIAHLKESKERIARGWTQQAFARDTYGTIVDAESPRAVCYCYKGALRAKVVKTPEAYTFEMDAYDRANAEVSRRGFASIVDFNDRPERTQSDVIESLNATIAEAEKDLTAAIEAAALELG